MYLPTDPFNFSDTSVLGNHPSVVFKLIELSCSIAVAILTKLSVRYLHNGPAWSVADICHGTVFNNHKVPRGEQSL